MFDERLCYKSLVSNYYVYLNLMLMNIFSRFSLLFVGARVWRDLDNQLPDL